MDLTSSTTLSLGFLTLAATISVPLFLTKRNEKRDFIEKLKNNINNAKHFIIDLEDKQYSQREKIQTVEKIRDFLMYQGYEKEKASFLAPIQHKKLFKLQEDLEDLIGNVLIQCDSEVCKMQSKEELNLFLKDL